MIYFIFHKKFQGYTLLYAVFVMVIVCVLCSSIIATSYFRKLLFLQHEKEFQLQLDVYSGLRLYLVNHRFFNEGKPVTVNLYNENKDHFVTITAKPWGVYSLVKAQAEWKNLKKEKSVLTAFEPEPGDQLALYLADHDKALSVCGKTRISGDACLPGSGIERGYIEGQNYLNDQLLYGHKKKSENRVPDAKELAVYLIKQTKPTSGELLGMQVVDFSFLEKDTVIRSFYDSTLLLYSESMINTGNKWLKGNIILYSKKGVVIEKNSRLSDLLVIAPFIKVKKEFRGNAQLIARDSLVSEEEVKLCFPSSLCLIDTDPNSENRFHTFSIAKKCEIDGFVFSYVRNAMETTSPPLLSTGESSVVKGQIYSNGYVELKGNIYGSVSCESFLLRTSASVYRNALLNASIEREKLPKTHGVMEFQMKGNLKKIIQWY